MQTNWVCRTEALRFCKNDSDSSHWLWLESSHSVKKRDSSRVESPSFSTWLESSQSHQKSWLDSSGVINSSHVITALCPNELSSTGIETKQCTFHLVAWYSLLTIQKRFQTVTLSLLIVYFKVWGPIWWNRSNSLKTGPVRRYNNVPLGRCWGSNDWRKGFELALTMYRDLMQGLF